MKLEEQKIVINPNTGHEVNMQEVISNVKIAISGLYSFYPFFKVLVNKLRIVYSFQLPTAATDSCRLIINPEFWSTLTIPLQMFVIMHETMHCALNHPERGKYMSDHNRTNIAMDYEVNGLLVADKLITPGDIKDYYYAEKYIGRSWDTIYPELPSGKKGDPQQGGGNGAGQGQGDDDSQSSSGNGSQASAKARQEVADANAGQSVGGVISQEAGSEIAKTEGYDAGDCAIDSNASATWKKAAMEAASKLAGQGGGNIARALNELFLTKHDWKNELKKYIGRAIANVDTRTAWGRRKFLSTGEVKKYYKTDNNNLSNIIFLIDTSGSVDDELLSRILSECYTICYRKDIKDVTYAYFDDGVREVETTQRIKDAGNLPQSAIHRIRTWRAQHKPKGGGGTSFVRALDWANELLHKQHGLADLVMIFTDGYDRVVPKPKYVKHMIWVIYDNPGFKAADNSQVVCISSKDLGM